VQCTSAGPFSGKMPRLRLVIVAVLAFGVVCRGQSAQTGQVSRPRRLLCRLGCASYQPILAEVQEEERAARRVVDTGTLRLLPGPDGLPHPASLFVGRAGDATCVLGVDSYKAELHALFVTTATRQHLGIRLLDRD
jgi:hypothetical protein